MFLDVPPRHEDWHWFTQESFGSWKLHRTPPAHVAHDGSLWHTNLWASWGSSGICDEPWIRRCCFPQLDHWIFNSSWDSTWQWSNDFVGAQFLEVVFWGDLCAATLSPRSFRRIHIPSNSQFLILPEDSSVENGIAIMIMVALHEFPCVAGFSIAFNVFSLSWRAVAAVFSCTSRSKDTNVSYLPQCLPAVGGQAKRSSIDPMLVADSVHFFWWNNPPCIFSMGVDDVDVCSLCYFWVGFSRWF